MRKEYVLGVDGGNTKTQYFLYDVDGNYKDGILAGTCSHEALPNSFDGAKCEIGKCTAELLSRNGITPKDVRFAVFGLAGADFDWQKDRLYGIVKSLGFENSIVENDGFLALKASSSVGVACINGTGTVTVGINEKGERVQIGGLGDMSGDKAGASYIAMRGLGVVYDAIYRGGKPSVLKDMIFDEFGIRSESDFAYAATNVLYEKDNVYKINKFMECAEQDGDETVKSVLREIGDNLAQTVAGCINYLHFEKTAKVILAGSVWVKGKFSAMYDSFMKTLREESKSPVSVSKLKQPPATGAVIWAIEEYRKFSGKAAANYDKPILIKFA